LKAVVYIS
jgi:hypothetical protein